MSSFKPGETVRLRQKSILPLATGGRACWMSGKEYDTESVAIVVRRGACECGQCSRPIRYLLLIDGELAYAQRNDIRRVGERKAPR